MFVYMHISFAYVNTHRVTAKWLKKFDTFQWGNVCSDPNDLPGAFETASGGPDFAKFKI